MILPADPLIWHTVNMTNGQTYDVSTASANTTVFISSPGTYALKGSSRNVRVIINSGGVNLYLENGLNINCGATSYTGSRTAAINVEEQGGTVKIISRKNSHSYIEGYMAPGIRKDGKTTALVFETEDPDHPGTIEVTAGSDCAGIGCIVYMIREEGFAGNITFNSGNIIAYGKGQGAGIGGSFGSGCDGIYINGGNVTAYGTIQGAGIGGGAQAKGRNIYISGGEVHAENMQWSTMHQHSTGAAIGGGGGAQGQDTNNGENIVISGGKVTAVSHGLGAAIGGGKDSAGTGIVISGGEVNAQSDISPAIGSGGGTWGNHVDVKITGGKVVAKGGEVFPAIGGKSGTHSHEGENNISVEITGGTVKAEKGSDPANQYDIGSDLRMYLSGTVKITGGSILANNIANAKDGAGHEVKRLNVSFEGITGDGIPVTKLECTTRSYNSYGMKDVFTQNGGKFYPWLPNEATALKTAYLEETFQDGKVNIPYTGSIAPGSTGTLTTQKIEIRESLSQALLGLACASPGDDRLTIIKEPPEVEGHYIYAYFPFGRADPLTEDESHWTFKANVPEFTDANGKWNRAPQQTWISPSLTLNDYTIRYDANKPLTASTEMSGSMVDTSTFYNDINYRFPDCGYSLPGYRFLGWDTDPDATNPRFQTGRSLQDYSLVSLSTKRGDIVILYAIWEPMTYTIRYESDNPNKTPATSEAVFDSDATLTSIADLGWQESGYTFHGWRVDGQIGSFYADGATVHNMVVYDGSGNPELDAGGNLQGLTMKAVWQHGTGGSITIYTTENGTGVDVLAGEGTFQIRTIGTPAATYTPSFTQGPTGTYTVTTPGIGEGNFQLLLVYPQPATVYEYVIPEDKQAFEYHSGDDVCITLEYYSAEIDNPDGGTGGDYYIAGEGGFTQPEDLLHLPKGSTITVHATAGQAGQHFLGYSVVGPRPGNFDAEQEGTQTNVEIKRKTKFRAYTMANQYTVHFDKNGGDYIRGQMEDQVYKYDAPAKELSANQFERTGGTFTGWNTERDGSGTAFTDGQSVRNLTTVNNGTVTLYAQWDEDTYNIEYDLDGGSLPAGRTNPATYYESSPGFTLNNPVKEDHIFEGWMGTGLTAPTTRAVIPEGSNGDRFYIANWRMIQYLVVFDCGDGKFLDSELVYVHGKATRPENPSRSGYTFTGWYTDQACKTAYDFNAEVTSNLRLYAGWKENETEPEPEEHQDRSSGKNESSTPPAVPGRCTVVYDPAGGTINGSGGYTIDVFTAGQMIVIREAPIRAGYRFEYWQNAANPLLRYKPKEVIKIEGNMVLTAVWKKSVPGEQTAETEEKEKSAQDTGGSDGPKLVETAEGAEESAEAGDKYEKTEEKISDKNAAAGPTVILDDTPDRKWGIIVLVAVSFVIVGAAVAGILYVRSRREE